MTVTLYYYGKGPAVSNLTERRADLTHGVRRNSWYGGWQQQVCVCYESHVKMGAVSSENLSASNRKLGYLSLTQGKKKCVLNINYKSMRTFEGRSNNHMLTQRERNSRDWL